MNDRTFEVRLRQGIIRYRDVGTGPVLVFVHGLLVNGTVWSRVVEQLSSTHRCIVPDWPLGSHGVAMDDDADLSPLGCAHLVGDFLEALGLSDVTLIGNDGGGAVAQLVAAHRSERLARLVLTSCDAFECFPPPMFAYLRPLVQVPFVLAALGRAMLAFPALRKLPFAYGRTSLRPLDDAMLESFVRPAARDPKVRRDVIKFLHGVTPDVGLAVARELAHFRKPVLLAWSRDDRIFPYELGERLSRTFPNARLVPIEDARTYSPLDAPHAVARAIEEFVAETLERPREGRTESAPALR